jgi:hypothetical protein
VNNKELIMFEQTVQDAFDAARKAEADFRAKHGEPFYCGFAWVEVYVDRTNSKQAKELMSLGFRKDYKPKCLTVWNPGGSGTQSMDIKEEGARAFAEVLSKAGLRAYACSRPD